MAANQLDSESPNSDDEIFIGKMSLKEIRKHLSINRQSLACPYPAYLDQEEKDLSVRIIETNSEPDLSVNFASNCKLPQTVAFSSTNIDYAMNKSRLTDNWENKSSDESFLNMEKIVNSLCSIPQPSKEGNLNVQEVNEISDHDLIGFNKDYKLQHHDMPMSEIEKTPIKIIEPKQTSYITPINNVMSSTYDEKKHFETPVGTLYTEEHITARSIQSGEYQTIQKNLFKSINADGQLTINSNQSLLTPMKTVNSDKYCLQRSVFKTPACPSSIKKPNCNGSNKKMNNFNHIASPIAAYIKNSPQVPLLKDIKPKKLLTGVSSAIPKLVKEPAQQYNKENANLPNVAYRSAKKTKLIDVQDEPRMPQSARMQKLVSSLPRPVIIKHEQRKNAAISRPKTRPEDSFADLSLHQADLSVCTQKSAMSPARQNIKK